MLTQDIIVSFYTKHDLIPSKDLVIISKSKYDSIVFDADNYGRSFRCFVEASLSPIDNENYGMMIEKWETLHDYYCSFITGFVGNKS